VPPEQVIDSFPGVVTTRIGLWHRASPVRGDRHANKTPGRPGMLFLPQNQARQRDRLGLPNPSC
jgi:hypothetical protein